MAHSKWGVLYIMSAALFIMFIDTTMMNVSISALVEDLDTTVSGVQSAITLYALVMAAFMITGAKLADIWGTKKVFFRGLVIYTVGTLMAAFAPNLLILIIGWSILEGIGASMMMPATVTYITKAYTGKDRAFAFGVWGGVGGAAAAFGPIIGGFFTTYITWRLGFFMEAFIAAGIFYGMKLLADYKPERKIKLDVVGATLVGVGLFLLTLSVLIMDPLTNPPVLLLMVLGLLTLWAFWRYEKKRKAEGKDVLIDVDIFKSKVFTAANLVSLFFQMTLAGIMFTVPVFVQQYLHYNAIQTGFVVVPLSIMMFIFSMG
ncbi:MFS transporter, partial [Thermococcus sp.]|uniref:MFS transporter n=1 Tax=Thermococcus sp. TaxID=35749 RepID=UPI002620E0A4